MIPISYPLTQNTDIGTRIYLKVDEIDVIKGVLKEWCGPDARVMLDDGTETMISGVPETGGFQA